MKQDVISVFENQIPTSLKAVKRELFYEGSVKNLYKSDKPDLIVLEFKNQKPPENGKVSEVKDLSVVRGKISSYLFKHLDGYHIPTHYVNKLSSTELLVKQLEIIPIIVRIYNLASGALSKRLGLKEGTVLTFPVVEHYQKNSDRSAVWINEYHVTALGIATPEEFKQINRIASKVNAVLRALCDRRQLMLVEFQMEFGRYKGQVVLAGELSPLTCRFLDLQQENKNGKIRLLQEQEDAFSGYSLLSDRLEMKV